MTGLRRYRFGEFVLSAGERRLRRGDQEVPLVPRYLDLLLLLVAERHRAVDREEIHERVWGGLAVTDGALTQAVRSLRRALGDEDPRQPRFIRTVSRHGYQFVHPLAQEEVEEAAGEGVPGGTTVPAVGVARSAGAAAAGAALAGLGLSLLLGAVLPLSGAAHWRLLPVLCLLGSAAGAWGGVAVGAGVALGAQAAASTGMRLLAVPGTVLGGALGGGLAGGAAHLLAAWTVTELLARPVSGLAGGVEGVVLGAAVALGLALGRSPVAAAGLAGALAAGALGLVGAQTAGTSLDTIAGALQGARLLAPLGELVGEEGAGPAVRLLVSLLEGGLFGAGVAWGLRRWAR